MYKLRLQENWAQYMPTHKFLHKSGVQQSFLGIGHFVGKTFLLEIFVDKRHIKQPSPRSKNDHIDILDLTQIYLLRLSCISRV